jgi:transposase-like protein
MRTAKDWGQPCPNPRCSHYNRMHQGNVHSVATYPTQSGKRRIFCCKVCQTRFSETRDTVFFDLRTPEERVMLALKMLLVRMDLSSIAFVLDVTEESVLQWLRRAAQKAEQINKHLLRELPVTQVQWDEMWNFIQRKHSQEAGASQESPNDSPDGRHTGSRE